MEIGAPLGPGDGHDVVSLGQHPGQGDLARFHAELVSQLLHLVDELEVLAEVVALEARVVTAKVVGRQVI